jgi:hypothetical protein
MVITLVVSKVNENIVTEHTITLTAKSGLKTGPGFGKSYYSDILYFTK